MLGSRGPLFCRDSQQGFDHGPTAPPNPTAEDAWLDTSTGDVKKWNGSQWVIINPASGGSDPWTYLKLASDFTTSLATAQDVTGLAFTPAANQSYEFEAMLMLRTATATVNPRVGLAWPASGMSDGVCAIREAQAATTQLLANGNIAAALLVAVGGLANNTQSWPCELKGIVRSGAAPSGNVKVQLASETAGTVVRVVAGSFLKYRQIP